MTVFGVNSAVKGIWQRGSAIGEPTALPLTPCWI